MACCGAGFSAGKFIAAIVAVGLGGFAAYNYATSGSLCGSCASDKDSAAVQTVGAEGSDACPMGACSDSKMAGDCCESGGDEACEGACPMTGMMEAAHTEAGAACDKPCDGGECDKPGDGACEGGECEGACPMEGAEVHEAAATSDCDKPCPESGCQKDKEEVASNSTEKSDG